MSIANMLTLMRIVLIPLFFVSFYLLGEYGNLIATFIFVVAAITDWLDGYLARSYNETTKFGAFLDPFADKLLVVCALIMVIGEMHSKYFVIPAAIIITREFTISALREWMAQLGKTKKVRVAFLGKIKTGFQLVALPMLIVYKPGYPIEILYIGEFILYCSACLALWSMIFYIKAVWPDLTFRSESQ